MRQEGAQREGILAAQGRKHSKEGGRDRVPRRLSGKQKRGLRTHILLSESPEGVSKTSPANSSPFLVVPSPPPPGTPA